MQEGYFFSIFVFMTIEEFMKLHDLNEETWVVKDNDWMAFYPNCCETYDITVKDGEVINCGVTYDNYEDNFPTEEEWLPKNAIKYKDLIIN